MHDDTPPMPEPLDAAPEQEQPAAEGADVLSDAPLQLVAQPRKVEKIDIGYAKVMKKVDVHALKGGLWRELETLTAKGKVPSSCLLLCIATLTICLCAQKQTSLKALVNRVPAAVPKQDLPDISTPYCFICLLHLANEHSLKLTGNGSLTDIQIEAS